MINISGIMNELGSHIFRNLMLNYVAPQSHEEKLWESSIRQRAKGLLLTHGRTPIDTSGLTEEERQQIQHAETTGLQQDVRSGRTWFLRPFFGSRQKKLSRLIQFNDFLKDTPLRIIEAPFEEHKLIIGSSLPRLREIVRQAYFEIMSRGSVPTMPRYSIDDCDLYFGSTAWHRDPQEFFVGYAISPEHASAEDIIAENRFIPRYPDARSRKQVEGILDYVQHHVSSSLIARR